MRSVVSDHDCRVASMHGLPQRFVRWDTCLGVWKGLRCFRSIVSDRESAEWLPGAVSSQGSFLGGHLSLFNDTGTLSRCTCGTGRGRREGGGVTVLSSQVIFKLMFALPFLVMGSWCRSSFVSAVLVKLSYSPAPTDNARSES